MIVKVQRSIVTSDDQAQCLVYNEDQSVLYQMPMTLELFDMFGDELKMYCYAELVDSIIVLEGEAPEQEW